MSDRHSFSLLDAVGVIAVVAIAVVVVKPHAARVGAADPPPATARPSPEVLAAATHLSLSGDVLWWTTGTAVYRTTLHTRAGAGAEVMVEKAPPGHAYGDIAAPYVVVNDFARHRSWIERLDDALPGDPARVVDAVAWIGEHDLVTDGAGAYWTDGVTARGTHLAPVAATAIDVGGGRVFVASGRVIRSMPLTGGPARVEVTTRTAVAALAVHGSSLSWAEADASIHGAAGRQYQVPVAGQRVTGVTDDGRRLLWSACDRGCHLAQRAGGVMSTVDVGADPHDLAGDGWTTVLVGGGRLLRWTAPVLPGRPMF